MPGSASCDAIAAASRLSPAGMAGGVHRRHRRGVHRRWRRQRRHSDGRGGGPRRRPQAAGGQPRLGRVDIQRLRRQRGQTRRPAAARRRAATWRASGRRASVSSTSSPRAASRAPRPPPRRRRPPPPGRAAAAGHRARTDAAGAGAAVPGTPARAGCRWRPTATVRPAGGNASASASATGHADHRPPGRERDAVRQRQRGAQTGETARPDRHGDAVERRRHAGLRAARRAPCRQGGRHARALLAAGSAQTTVQRRWPPSSAAEAASMRQDQRCASRRIRPSSDAGRPRRTKPRRAGEQRGRVAVADIDQEIRLPAAVGKKAASTLALSKPDIGPASRPSARAARIR